MFWTEEAEVSAKAESLSLVTAYTLPLVSLWPGLSGSLPLSRHFMVGTASSSNLDT